MLFQKSQKRPLLKCYFAHQMRGRVRIVCRAVRYLAQEQNDLESHFSELRGVTALRMNCLASSVILNYDPEMTSADDLIDSVESIIASHSLNALQMEREERNRLAVQERDLHEEPFSTMLLRSAAAGGLLLASWLTRASVPATITGRLFGFTGLGALSLAAPLFRSGFDALRKSFLPNADTLSAMAVLSSVLTGKTASALTVLLLHDAAEAMTVYTMDRTRNAIRDMLSVDNEQVWRPLNNEVGGALQQIPVSELKLNDLIVVHTGEKICADGVIVAGRAMINQASITGEFEPVTREVGGKIFAGTIVADGVITARVESVGDQTAVSRIIRMVEDAEGKKAAIQTYADRFSSALVPVNILLAGVVYFATRDINRALNMLIIDYSCGIRLSTAAALSAAISTAARNGVLIKGGGSIESLTEADTLILDKTGTLTEGKPRVVSITTNSEQYQRMDIMAFAAAAEETSKHPMAVAILSHLQRNGGHIPPHGEIQTVVGRGVYTEVDGHCIRVGSKRFLNESGIHTHPMKEQASKLFSNGESVIFVARDLEQQADVVAQRLGLDGFESELLPEDKARAVLRMQSGGNKVVMVGDGINDAPGLAYADVGIALGKTRTDIAMEAADITIAGDNALMLPGVYGLAHHTMDVIRQNFFVSVGINTVGLLFGGLGMLPVIFGAVMHNASTILVVGNSLRIFFYDMHEPVKHN